MPLHVQSNFTGGEQSPSVGARVDIPEFQSSVKTMLNFYCHIQGGASNRPGTRSLDNLSDGNHQLQKFEYSVVQAYGLVFTDQEMYVLKDGEIVQDPSGGNYVLTTPYLAADLDELKFTQSADVLYVVHPNYQEREISRLDHDDWTIEVVSYDEDPTDDRTIANVTNVWGFEYDSEAGVVTIDAIDDTPFNEDMVGRTVRFGVADLTDPESIEWTAVRMDEFTNSASIQSASATVGVYTGRTYTQNWNFKTGTLNWTDVNGMTWDETEKQAILTHDGTVGEMTQAIDVAESVSLTMEVMIGDFSGSASVVLEVGTTFGGAELVTDTFSAATGSVSVEFTTTQDIAYITVKQSGGASGNTLNLSSIVVYDKNMYTEYWRTPAFKGEGYYPSVAGFFEQRLILGATLSETQSLWHSKTGQYYNFGFSSPLQDDDSFKYTLAAGDVNAIRWITPLQELIVATEGGIWKIDGGGSSMTPFAIDAKKKYSVGAAKQDPVVVGENILYIESGRTKVQEVTSVVGDQGYTYQGMDITIAAAHLFEGKTIVDWTYARNPDSIVWCVLSDGTAVGLTYSNTNEVYGWHRHETDGLFKNVVAVTGSPNDYVYWVVERTTDAGTKRYIESMQPRITDIDTGDWWFVDAGVRYSGSEKTDFTGLDHLIGETVSIVADGGVVPDQVVDASGGIQLDNSASVVIAGLPYQQTLETLSLDLTVTDGNLQGLAKSVPRVVLSVYKTRGYEIGTDEDDLIDVKFTDPAAGITPYVETGEVEAEIASDNDTSLSILISNSYPVPITIRAIMPEVRLVENVG